MIKLSVCLIFQVAYNRVQNSLPTLRPNRSFIEQLSLWEEILFGENTTNVDDPHF